ncbi:3-oxoacyl-ACP reductase [Vibrio sp. 10N.286.49.C2]|uniref:SDR family NAD(P)-dependent oxidoreductase n=1 Tax=unclassified Vibrio TaxID=2614977 RepID=UPI000C86244E|nr:MULTISPECIES: SDR family oxidoreductase [unclassified Vibrio]PMH29580.1 3-oxoacyl-ACP reductase [Vibrio sp. 10N.286.49.C2]PMH56095.1 3-oxoacyl-ACP reductase [Vibrio sp. 10N.286.49.B1]PMH77644.1 3-oxoacyl-ACP reductase [Vibrio sp. 10N.286.48.B7]
MAVPFHLTDKVIVVIGGTSGIGEATALRLHNAGGRLVIAGLDAVASKNRSLDALYIDVDVTDEIAISELMAITFEHFGRIDVLVNCAGSTNGYSTIMESKKAEYDANYAVNALGTALAIKHAVPYMPFKSSIINVASSAGTSGVPYLGALASSKWAVLGITKTAALELGNKQIRVNAVCPTSVDTPRAHAEGGEPQLRMEQRAVPLGRIGQPEEVAAVIHFLASQDSSFVNGQAIGVDGGFSAGMSIDAYNQLAQ